MGCPNSTESSKYLLTCSTVEFATVGQTSDGKIYHRLWSAEEIKELLKEHDLAKDENTEEK